MCTKRLLLVFAFLFCCSGLASAQDISVKEVYWSELMTLLQANGDQYLTDSETLNSSSDIINNSETSILLIENSTQSLNQNLNSSEQIINSSEQTTTNLDKAIEDISKDNKELKKSSNKSTWIIIGISAGSLLVGFATGFVVGVMN